MLFDKSGIDERWWCGLTDCIKPAEVVETLADAKFVSAPGEDGVSTGVWRLALQSSAALRLLVPISFIHCLVLWIFLLLLKKKQKRASSLRLGKRARSPS
jgi:hypothetical protein